MSRLKPVTEASTLTMPLLTRYCHLKKQDASGKFVKFHALRAVGLALEKALKLARHKGERKVKEADLGVVQITGQLQQLREGAWERLTSCRLSLGATDGKLSLNIFRHVQEYLRDLAFNVDDVDVKLNSIATLDLLGSVASSSGVPVDGKIWVETKARQTIVVFENRTVEVRHIRPTRCLVEEGK